MRIQQSPLSFLSPVGDNPPTVPPILADGRALVLREGFEPPLRFRTRILSPLRLPFPPPEQIPCFQFSSGTGISRHSIWQTVIDRRLLTPVSLCACPVTTQSCQRTMQGTLSEAAAQTRRCFPYRISSAPPVRQRHFSHCPS